MRHIFGVGLAHAVSSRGTITLKIAAIPLVLLLSVGLSGCDEYDSVEQCRVKEMQKCKTSTCNAMALAYCEKIFKKQSSKKPWEEDYSTRKIM